MRLPASASRRSIDVETYGYWIDGGGSSRRDPGTARRTSRQREKAASLCSARARRTFAAEKLLRNHERGFGIHRQCQIHPQTLAAQMWAWNVLAIRHDSANSQATAGQSFQRFAPGTILDALAGRYEFRGSIDAGRYVTVLQAEFGQSPAAVMPSSWPIQRRPRTQISSNLVRGPAVKCSSDAARDARSDLT